MQDYLKHYGTPRHSGRYPWGSGGNSEQRNKSFLGYVKQLQEEGLTEKQIAEGMGLKIAQLRAKKSIAKAEERAAAVAQATRLKDKGLSNVAIGQRMGLNESSVRALLDVELQAKADITFATAKMLSDAVNKKGYIDVGAGTENHLGITRTKLNTALAELEEQGYKVHYIKVEQLGTGKYTSIKVLAPAETSYSEIYKNRDKIRMVTDHTVDGGRSWRGLGPIKNVDSKRILIRYKEEGGEAKDGIIELRRGVNDLSLGNSKYAQVRVAVDGTHFMKGMAMYADKMPDGVDIIYNTKKTVGTEKAKVFKPMTSDPDNPFGSTIDAQLGALNIVNKEGDWKEWARNISSQVLSKQNVALAKKQLDLDRNLRIEELEEINKLTNPTVKRQLLYDFANEADSAAVHLKAAALPRQSQHVILPITDMKPNEIYAPYYNNGERVILIRHPHGGTFEIPELTVNNKNPSANKLIQNAEDAVGIHPSVASKLSGADFDGDTVIVIPNNQGLIKTSPSLKGLAGFDPITSYPSYEGMTKMDSRTKGIEMGKVSNLITDMTIKGASHDEIARAVRHSMVVIDAEKHGLNWKQSAIDNNIAALKKKYQGGETSGASTLISKASSEFRVPRRKDNFKIDPATGQKIYEKTGESFVNDKGKIIERKTLSTRMAETNNAFELSSGTRMEAVYAEHANALKDLANTARKQMVATKPIEYSPTARQTYDAEVRTLKAKLNIADMNRPLERQAQLLANKIVQSKRAASPDMDAATLKKVKGQVLEEARNRTGAKKKRIVITDREWEAIQLGAISNNTLSRILLNTDMDEVRSRALPRTKYKMTDAKIARAKSMASAGYTQAEIASALGVSASTVNDVL